MNKVEYKGINDVVYYEQLDNGLKVYMVPKRNFHTSYVTFTTKYGGMNNTFTPINDSKMINVPDGIAHFLEHKMFEQENGEDPFSFFMKKGLNCNAYTSSKITSYLFSGTGDIKDATDYLLDYVQSPYFTDKNVLKEKGIIEEEIKMYEDYPSVVSYYGLLKNIFKNNPVKTDVAGKVSDIKKITKEDLYTCYNTFYHPSNMIMVLTGNFDPKELMDVIRKNQNGKKFKKFKPIKLPKIDEPNVVNETYEERKMAVELPKVLYGIKLKKIKWDNEYEKMLYLTVFVNSLFNATTDFHERMILEEKIVDFITSEVMNMDSHDLILLGAESTKPDKLIEEVTNYLKNIDISKETFERQKKVLYSSILTGYDDIYTINNLITQEYLEYGIIITDKLELISKLNYKKFLSLIKNVDLSNISSFVVKPLEEK